MKNNQLGDFSKLFEILSKSDQKSKQQVADKIISNFDAQENQQFEELIKDRNKIDTILNSPVAKQIMNKIKQNNNGQLK